MISTILYGLVVIAALLTIISEIVKYKKSHVMRLGFYFYIGLAVIIIGLVYLDSTALIGKILICAGAAIAILGSTFMIYKSNRKKTKSIK